MITRVMALMAAVCVAGPMRSAIAETATTSHTSKISAASTKTRILEREDGGEKPVDLFAAPVVAARWLGKLARSQVDVSVKIAR